MKLDDSDNSPGWKFAQYEMKGVPLRLEIGPKDIENNQCVLVTRHNREKTFVSLDELPQMIEKKLQEVHDGIYRAGLGKPEGKDQCGHHPGRVLGHCPEQARLYQGLCGAGIPPARTRLRI